eukprot:1152565-Pelagomonas_calceolata.AAC.6
MQLVSFEPGGYQTRAAPPFCRVQLPAMSRVQQPAVSKCPFYLVVPSASEKLLEVRLSFAACALV